LLSERLILHLTLREIVAFSNQNTNVNKHGSKASFANDEEKKEKNRHPEQQPLQGLSILRNLMSSGSYFGFQRGQRKGL